MSEADPALDSYIYCFRCQQPTYSEVTSGMDRVAWHCRKCGGLTDEMYFDPEDADMFKVLTPEEAEAALDGIEGEPMSEQEIANILEYIKNAGPEKPQIRPKTPYNSAFSG